jgi:hypothetical protein
MLTDSNKIRIDHIKHISHELADLPEHKKELVYLLSKHIIQLCSNEYEKDIKEICSILKI